MQILKARLIEKVTRTPTIQSFRFIPEKRIDFIPGQFLQLIFDPLNHQNKELNKYLSFSCPPSADYVEVTKRLSESSFSQRLRNLKPDEEISIKGPLGNCIFKEEYKKVAFLIGGIGITPVISILGYIVENNLSTDAILVYSNRTEEETAFRKELGEYKEQGSNIKIFYTVTEAVSKNKSLIYGRISKELLAEKIKDIKERTFFIFGPPKMVEALALLCLEAGSMKEKVKAESFLGY